MANTDPLSIAQSGIDPATGSPLSSDVRKALFKSSRISASAFTGGGGGALVRSQSAESVQSLQLARANQQSLGTLGSQIQALRTEVGNLSANLTQIAGLVTQESSLEQQRLRSQAENERRLAEAQSRFGKENEIEKQISTRATAQSSQLAPKITNIFDRIKQSLMYVFLGWLTNQSIELFKAQSEGDTQKVKDIQFSILKNIGIGIASLLALKLGFNGIVRLITGITGRIGGLLGKIVLSPFQGLMSGVTRLGGGGRTAAPRTGGSPGGRPGGGGSSILGKGLLALGGIGDLFSGQFTDATVAGLALKGPGIVRPIAGTVYGVDTITEMFGGNVLGENPNQPKPSTTPPAKTSAAAVSSPQTPSIPPKQQSTQPQPSPQETSTPINSVLPSASSLSLVASRGEQGKDKSDSYNLEEITRSVEEAKEKDLKGKDSAQIMSPTQPTPNLNPPAKPTPNVVVAPAPTPKQSTMPSASPPSSQSASDVPLISSSNPDNFYTLYSQLNYNVVM